MDEQPSFAGDDEFGYASNRARDDRQACRHGFEYRERHAFGSARKHEHVALCELLRDVAPFAEQCNVLGGGIGVDRLLNGCSVGLSVTTGIWSRDIRNGSAWSGSSR